MGIQGQSVTNIAPIETDAVDGICPLAREYDGLDLIEVWASNTPLALRI